MQNRVRQSVSQIGSGTHQMLPRQKKNLRIMSVATEVKNACFWFLSYKVNLFNIGYYKCIGIYCVWQ